MRNLRSSLCLLAATAAVSSMACFPSPALADHSVGVGYFAPTPEGRNMGLIATTGLTLPIVPIAPQLAVAIPFSGGRYAVTGEGRIALHTTTLGLGAGVGRFNTTGPSGTIFDAFIGQKVAPLTSLEARYYSLGDNHNGSTGYIGVRVALP